MSKQRRSVFDDDVEVEVADTPADFSELAAEVYQAPPPPAPLLPRRPTYEMVAGELHLSSGVKLTTTRLVLPAKLSQEHWGEIGSLLRTTNSSLNWWIGDWLNCGLREWGDDSYQWAEIITGLKRATLYNIASVAKKIDFSRRNEKCSFKHHAAVASLDPEIQRGWLAESARHDWSYAELKRAMKTAALTEGQQDQQDAKVIRRQQAAAVAKIAALAYRSRKPITADQYADIEAQVSAMLEQLQARIR